MITQSELKKIVRYNKESGDLVWLVDRGTYKCKGKSVGWVDAGRGKTKYLKVRISPNVYKVHRLIFLYVTGKWPDNVVDHEDGNGLNNKWENLRDVTNMENLQNSRKYATNTSGVTGVILDSKSGKWKAQIETSVSGVRKNKNLGRFDDFNDAVIARKAAEDEYGFHKNHGMDRE